MQAKRSGAPRSKASTGASDCINVCCTNPDNGMEADMVKKNQQPSGDWHPTNDSPAHSATISLRELFPRARFVGNEDIVATGLSRDPADCTAGHVVVIDCATESPVDAATSAMAHGAAGIVCEQLLPCPLPQCIVSDCHQAVAVLADAVAGHPAKDVFTVGIVGSSGKTTTAILTTKVLRAAGLRTGFYTNLGDSDGIVESTPSELIADAPEFTAWISEARDAGCGVAVVELSETMLRGHALDAASIDLLVITSNVRASSEFGPSVLDLALERLSPSGLVLVSADSPQAVRRVDDSGAGRITYGLRRPADISAKIFEQIAGQTTLLVTAKDCTAAMETSLTGPAMAANQLAAIAVGLVTEMSLENAIEVVSRVGSVPGRNQRLAEFDAATVILDTAGNSHRLNETLRGLRRERGTGQLWCIASVEPGTDEGTCAGIGASAQRFSDQVILTSSRGDKANFLQRAHAMLDGVPDVAEPRLIADRDTAIRWAVQRAAPDDIIVIAGGFATANPAAHRRALQADETAVREARQQQPTASKEMQSIIPFSTPLPR